MLIALAAGAAALSLGLAARHDRRSAGAAGPYACPMHPEVTAQAPRECPICGMSLVKASKVGSRLPGRGPRTALDALPEDDGVIAAEAMLAEAAGGVAPNLVGYYPSPVRQHVLRYEIYAPAWIEDRQVIAVLYGDQLPTLEPGEHAVFFPTADPRAELGVRLGPGPAVPWDRSTSLVRFDPDRQPRGGRTSARSESGAQALRPGAVGWVRFAPRPRRMRVVPAASVLYGDEGPYVLAFSRADGTAARRAVEIGRTTTGWAAVLAGLELREQVVSVNAFYWDAERRLRAGARP